MALKLSNNAVGFLAATLAATDTSIALQPGQGALFPVLANGDWFPGTLVASSGAIEIVRVTARSTDSLTVARAQEGTAAQAFSPGARLELRMTAGAQQGIVDDLKALIDAISPRVGDIKIWRGAIADIASIHGPGWQLANGTNGTTDLRDKFIVAAGGTYAPGDTGGAASVALTVAQMPAHAHQNTLAESPHTHGNSLTDNGHTHAFASGSAWTNGGPQTWGGGSAGYIGVQPMNYAKTNIVLNNAGATTGISITNASQGGGAAHENRPPYYALAFIEYIGTA
jgi:microcystin-dependent protein